MKRNLKLLLICAFSISSSDLAADTVSTASSFEMNNDKKDADEDGAEQTNNQDNPPPYNDLYRD